MSTTQTHTTVVPPCYDIRDLLEQAGFRVRGRRADCIHCKGTSRLAVSFNEEVAFCHRCHWTTNVVQLAKGQVRAATEEYRESSDRTRIFLEGSGRLVFHSNAQVGAQQLYDVYKEWCAEVGESHILIMSEFRSYVERRGYSAKRAEKGWFWRGIGIAEPISLNDPANENRLF